MGLSPLWSYGADLYGRRMRRVALAVATMAAALLALASPAAAAQPAIPNCFGEDISGLASTFGSGYAQFVVSMTKSGAPGVAEGVHAHKAGLIPDFVVPNACNN